jgi:hypothetical protein
MRNSKFSIFYMSDFFCFFLDSFPAPECSPIGLPREYHSPFSVSQPSSRWIGVVPKKLGHQKIDLPHVFPTELDSYERRSLSRHKSLYVLVKLNRPISASQLQPLLAFHLIPIKRLVLPWPERALILEWASYLDAFSSYPLRT